MVRDKAQYGNTCCVLSYEYEEEMPGFFFQLFLVKDDLRICKTKTSPPLHMAALSLLLKLI